MNYNLFFVKKVLKFLILKKEIITLYTSYHWLKIKGAFLKFIQRVIRTALII